MLEFTVNEILGVKIGIRVHSYFGVADNGNVVYSQKFRVLGAEHPVPVASAVPVVGRNPPLPLMGVTALRPSPQQFIEDVVDMGKGFTGADRLMVIRPATNLLAQLFNQDFLFPYRAREWSRTERLSGLSALSWTA